MKMAAVKELLRAENDGRKIIMNLKVIFIK